MLALETPNDLYGEPRELPPELATRSLGRGRRVAVGLQSIDEIREAAYGHNQRRRSEDDEP